MKKTVTIKMSRTDALKAGLLICKCGYYENQHFNFGHRFCARNSKCKGYSEVSRYGRIVAHHAPRER